MRDNLETLKEKVIEIKNSKYGNARESINTLSEICFDLENECRIIHDLFITESITFNLDRYRKIHSELVDCIIYLRKEIKGLEKQ